VQCPRFVDPALLTYDKWVAAKAQKAGDPKIWGRPGFDERVTSSPKRVKGRHKKLRDGQEKYLVRSYFRGRSKRVRGKKLERF
jgi:hypothetical protein